MIVRYEYTSTCCNHLYMETRSSELGQLVTKCNICQQGDYVLVNEVVLEDLPPVVVEEQVVAEEEPESTVI